MGSGGSPAAWDFFVSYTQADRRWAEWVAWQLEDAGYHILIQSWDFVAGTRWYFRINEAVQRAERTIAILSGAYLESIYGQEEWQAALLADPGGFRRKLLPIRIENCPRPGMLGQVVSIDLFDRSESEARRYLVDQVRGTITGRIKPAAAPDFPVPPRSAPPVDEPVFPAAGPATSFPAKLLDVLTSYQSDEAAHRATTSGPPSTPSAAANEIGLPSIAKEDRSQPPAVTLASTQSSGSYSIDDIDELAGARQPTTRVKNISGNQPDASNYHGNSRHADDAIRLLDRPLKFRWPDDHEPATPMNRFRVSVVALAWNKHTNIRLRTIITMTVAVLAIAAAVTATILTTRIHAAMPPAPAEQALARPGDWEHSSGASTDTHPSSQPNSNSAPGPST